MENTRLIQTDKTHDHDSLVLASLVVKDVDRLIRCIRAITALLVRFAAIAISISDSLRRCVEPAAAMQQHKHAQRMEVLLQCSSIAKLPLAG